MARIKVTGNSALLTQTAVFVITTFFMTAAKHPHRPDATPKFHTSHGLYRFWQNARNRGTSGRKPRYIYISDKPSRHSNASARHQTGKDLSTNNRSKAHNNETLARYQFSAIVASQKRLHAEKIPPTSTTSLYEEPHLRSDTSKNAVGTESTFFCLASLKNCPTACTVHSAFSIPELD